MADDWLKEEARARQAKHEDDVVKAHADLERCPRFADHYYKFFDALVSTVVAALDSYNSELKVEGFRIAHKREGYSLRAYLVGDPSCRIDFDGYTDTYPSAGGQIHCRYGGKGKSNEYRVVEKQYALALEDHGMVLKENDIAVPRSALAERFLRPFFERMP
jgi:hypothetical protein